MRKLFVLKYGTLLSLIMLTGCTTYSVTVIHSEGVSEDTLTDSQTLEPTTNASASIPASIIPK